MEQSEKEISKLFSMSLFSTCYMNSEILRKRCVDFSTLNLMIGKELLKHQVSINFGRQLIRSSSSVALNYSEAISAESKRDFIHKLNLSLKELRETYSCLEIIKNGELLINQEQLLSAYGECNELISIFVKSVKTSKQNLKHS